MSVAVSVMIWDGVVLATDSASTMTDSAGIPVNVYNNANKIVNLFKSQPIGLMFWGAGNIGTQSMSVLAKEFRDRLTGDDPKWHIDTDAYTMSEVAQKVADFFHAEKYSGAFLSDSTRPPGQPLPSFGMQLTGFAANSETYETFGYNVDAAGALNGPTAIVPSSSGTVGQPTLTANAMIEPILRLAMGHSSQLIEKLVGAGIDRSQLETAFKMIKPELEAPLISPAMPIQDAIDLAEWLVDVTSMYYRFVPGHPVVGGPTEVATITRHEGFRWIRRKHFYHQDLNP